jgi:hypothetical protein
MSLSIACETINKNSPQPEVATYLAVVTGLRRLRSLEDIQERHIAASRSDTGESPAGCSKTQQARPESRRLHLDANVGNWEVDISRSGDSRC